MGLRITHEDKRQTEGRGCSPALPQGFLEGAAENLCSCSRFKQTTGILRTLRMTGLRDTTQVRLACPGK